MTRPQTRGERQIELVHNALRHAEAALTSNDTDVARLWLERAHRLSPIDPTVMLSLAKLRLRTGDPTAIPLFAALARETDLREAWFGLAAASWRAGDPIGAATALARMLQGYVMPEPLSETARLADAICRDAGLSGWCGIAATGTPRRLVVQTSGAKARVRLDGRALRGRDLNAGLLLEAEASGARLLGSPIDLIRLRRVEGFVTEAAGGLEGWAWCPGDPDQDPVLTLRSGSQAARIVAADDSMIAIRPLMRPKRFRVPQAELPQGGKMIHVIGADGRELSGSPLAPHDPLAAATAIARAASRASPASDRPRRSILALASAPAELSGPPAHAPADPMRAIAIVIPVYAGLGLTQDCLAGVLATMPPATKVIVVDDATPEPAMAAFLDDLSADGLITLLRNRSNQGFPASANTGLRAALALQPLHDVLLLNNDTAVPQHPGRSWLDRLHTVVHAAPDIGSATPLSNDATILSYPNRDSRNTPPGAEDLAHLDTIAARVNASETVDIPTGVGFCLYLRHECLIQTGLFRPELFAQGYGEENDLCIRARHLGWRHVAVPGVVVAHRGGASFGHAAKPLVTRNLAVLERLHPGYHALITAYKGHHPTDDPLAPARRRMDAARFTAGRRSEAVILITHDSSGGVERVVRTRCRALAEAGQRVVVLRPIPDPDSTEAESLPGLCRVSDGAEASHPNLIYHLPQELPALAELLSAEGAIAIEVHHRLGHHPSVVNLAEMLNLPVDLHQHDYAAFCPRITLIGPERRYCGEPADASVCDACVADAGSRLEEKLSAAELRARSAGEIASCRSLVVPSPDMATRLRRHFPDARPIVAPLEHDPQPLHTPPPGRARHVCVIGAIGPEKGYDVLLACARDAARRGLDLRFTLAGHSTDDARLEATGRVFVTGRYDDDTACDLIRGLDADLAFLPSIWPETWGFTLGLAWSSGLRAMVFDIGAMAARVRASGLGWVLPLALGPSAINNLLMAPPPSR